GIAQLRAKHYDDAIRALEQAQRIDAHQAEAVAYLAFAHARAGNLPAAMEQQAELVRLKTSTYVGAYHQAGAAAARGATDENFGWLRRAHQAREDALSVLPVDPVFEDLHGDPRFAALLRDIGLPPASR